MSPDAIHGTGGAYVPCDELAAALPPVPAGAIVGHGVGFVARNEVAASLPAQLAGAIVGSEVGFVANPCEPCLMIAGYVGRRIIRATEMGGTTTVVSGPTYVSLGVLVAAWNSYDSTSEGDLGNQEFEYRSFLTWIVPFEASYVHAVGYAVTVLMQTDPETNGRPQETTVVYELGPVTLAPLIEPADFDNTGTGYGGSVTFLDANPQVPVPIDFLSSDIAGTYVDVVGDYGPPGLTWRLFQLAIRNVSPDGIGRHEWFAAPGHADGTEIEVIERFPDNPNWHRAGLDYQDYSMVSSRVDVHLEVFAHE